MRKLVLGIIAVVCVQFAFVIFMNLQAPLDLAAGPITPDPSANETDLGWIDELDRTVHHRSELVPTLNTTERNVRAQAPPTRRTSSPVLPRPSQKRNGAVAKKYIYFPEPEEASPSDFETVVISYNRPAFISARDERAPQVSDCEKVAAPTVKKRSYFSKAAPVVKKPWEVMKSIASKLY